MRELNVAFFFVCLDFECAAKIGNFFPSESGEICLWLGLKGDFEDGLLVTGDRVVTHRENLSRRSVFLNDISGESHRAGRMSRVCTGDLGTDRSESCCFRRKFFGAYEVVSKSVRPVEAICKSHRNR